MGKSNEREFIKKVGNHIREIRVEQNMTQLDLAIKCEMEENAVQRIETGRTNPTIKTLLKISNGLNRELEISFIQPEFN